MRIITTDDPNILIPLQLFCDGWNKHDSLLFSSAFFEDADFTNVFGVSKKGRKEIMDLHEPLFKTVWSESTLLFTNISSRYIRKDLISVDVRWELSHIIYPNSSQRGERNGLLHFIIENRNDDWRILVMHNMDLPKPESQVQKPMECDMRHEVEISLKKDFLDSRIKKVDHDF